MATITGTVTITADDLSEYTDLLSRAQEQTDISNLLEDSQNLTLTFDLNSEA